MTEVEKQFKDYIEFIRSDDLDFGDVVLIHGVMGIVGEAGELVGILKRQMVYGGRAKREDIAEELGDLLHYMMYLMNEHGLTLSELMCYNMAKLKKRFPQGFSKADAVKRANKE